MSKDYTSKDSQTDWKRLSTMRDEDIDLSDVPEITDAQMGQSILRIGGQPVAKKVRVNRYLDAAIVEYFKTRAGGRGYQTLINDVLRETIRENRLEAMLRRVIREELEAVK